MQIFFEWMEEGMYSDGMLIDAHCHLDFPTFLVEPEDQGKVILRARVAGVKMMVNVGCDLASSMSGLALARIHDFIFCTFGVHPNDSETWNEEVKERFFRAISEDRSKECSKIVAIGEIGLDYYRMGAPRDVQQCAFREQLRLAKQLHLPVVVHCRDAFSDVLGILEDEDIERVDFHCFSGDLEIAKRIWEHGWVTSFTAVVSYPNNDELRQVVAECPDGQYFLETDSPFLPHQTIRGERNEPAYLVKLGEIIAQSRNMKITEVADQTSHNAREFFRLPFIVSE